MAPIADRACRAGRSLRSALELGWAGLAWLAVASAVAAVAVVTLLVAAEDVVEKDGIAVHDPTGLAWFVDHRSSAAVEMARVVTWLGSASVLVLVTVVAGYVLWRRGWALVLTVAPVVAGVASVVGASAAKQIFGRPRPPAGLRLVVATEPAFPSGHATSSTAVYLTIALVVAAVLRRPAARVAVVAVAMALAGAVGLSRLTLGVHWPSDVVAGWALGTLVAVVVSTLGVLVTRVRPAASPSHASRARRSVGWLQQVRGS